MLKNLTFSLEQGKIYGLIGLNGAGKTTLMNSLAGLVKTDSGMIQLFGSSTPKELVQQREKVGSLIGSPAIHPNLTAYENLNLTRISRGIPNKELIEQTLLAVNLDPTSKKRVKHYSLGMKQRLGIANALFGNPAFLMLDEPTNGLDPISLVEIRQLLLKANQEKNITMLISSNTLSELDQLATDYLILHKGQIIEQITQQELQDKCRRHLALQVDELAQALPIIEQKLQISNYIVMPDGTLKLYEGLENLNRIFTCLADHQIQILNVTMMDDSLENYFVDRMKEPLL
ncbi:hypothetical protein RV10_GL001996 [Enterococcus pallens]|nr:hypothetical protein RV10_GL001996 [Enterococcus pallens]